MKTAAFLLIIFLFPTFLFTQTESTGELRNDSIKTKINFETFFNRAEYLSDIYFEDKLSTLLLNTQLLEDENFLILKLSYLDRASTPEVNDAALPQNILMPLNNIYKENQKFNMVRAVLGIAQTAAVGYMAYRHIKKYGFWK